MNTDQDLLSIVTKTFPELDIQDFSVLGKGRYGVACLVNKNIVFKISHLFEKAIKDAQIENYILKKLQDKVSFEIPHILYDGRFNSDRFVFGESLVNGVTYSQELHDSLDEDIKSDILQQIGHIVRELHNVQIDDKDKILHVAEYTETIGVFKDYFSDDVRACLSISDQKKIQQLCDRYEYLSKNYPVKKVLVHADLHFENMMFDKDKKQITGLIDFGSAHFAEPSRDLHYYRDSGLKNFMIGYGTIDDPYFLERQKFQCVINFLSDIGEDLQNKNKPDKNVTKLLSVLSN